MMLICQEQAPADRGRQKTKQRGQLPRETGGQGIHGASIKRPQGGGQMGGSEDYDAS